MPERLEGNQAKHSDFPKLLSGLCLQMPREREKASRLSRSNTADTEDQNHKFPLNAEVEEMLNPHKHLTRNSKNWSSTVVSFQGLITVMKCG